MRGSLLRIKFIILSLLLLGGITQQSAHCDVHARCKRIVSLAPSVTEAIFALGLGPQVVGVTRFCRHPAEAVSLPKVGGFYDVGVEALVSLKPSAVFSVTEGINLTTTGERFDFIFRALEHRSLAGIKQSLQVVGEVCGVEAAAKSELIRLEGLERELARRTHGVESKRVMIVVGHATAARDASIYISGNDAFYSDIVALLGAQNVHEKSTIAVPTLSHEGISKLDPDVIVEIVNADDATGVAEVERFWRQFSELKAVKSHAVFALSDDFASIPSVRYPQLAFRLGAMIYPERFSEKAASLL
jgi:iron complex transport system substrate-binding protein